jgi:hypothetical protein
MLAALLLNLGTPADIAAPKGFGGGPFYRKYGYDSAYDDIREQTTSAIPALEIPQVHVAALDYNFPKLREPVATDAAIDLTLAKLEADSEDELMMIFLLS